MQKLSVETKQGSYPVLIGTALLEKAPEVLKDYNFSSLLLVTNPLIDELYGKKLEKDLITNGFKLTKTYVPDGEEAKSIATASFLWDKALNASLDRTSAIIALGGGVVGDVAGFVAATFLRGIPWVGIPTTLLAQVDSSVGGKTAINHPQAKNIIGAFHQPSLVLADLDTLKTLDEREKRAGMGEVIKYAAISGFSFLDYLQKNMRNIFTEDEILAEVIYRCCAKKATIVAEDEKEGGIRAVLNFGHTVGHALEAATDFKLYRHGEAVAIGMVTEAFLAVNLQFCREEVALELKELVESVPLPSFPPAALGLKELLPHMRHDKKNKCGTFTLVLPVDRGRVEIIRGLKEEEIIAAWPF